MAVLLVNPAVDCQGQSGQPQVPSTAAARTATIAAFKVSVVKSVSLSNYQVPDTNNPFLGAAIGEPYNMALVLQVTSTAAGNASLSDRQLDVQVVDDTKARHNALGYIPSEIGRTESTGTMQTSVALDSKTNAVTLTRVYSLENGETLTAEEAIDSGGRRGWTLHVPAGKPIIVSCIFWFPSDRKPVQVALAGVKDLLPIPAPQR
jgi:hypothetical protein